MNPLSTRRVAAVGVAALAILVAWPAGVLAADEPNGSASCLGIEMASISPPGSSDEEPGGARQLVQEVRAFAELLGIRPGALFAWVASLHAGSHADCDEALEAGP